MRRKHQGGARPARLAGAALALALGACGPSQTPQQRSETDDGRPPEAAPTAGERAQVHDPAPSPADPAPDLLTELPPEPVLDPAIRAAREQAQRRQLLAKEQPLPDLPPVGAEVHPPADDPEAEALPGYFVPLELPPETRSDPLRSFEEALAALELDARDEPVRIAVYGASGVAADRWTGYVRAYLQARFGDGGPGIVPAVAPHRWSRHQELRFDRSNNWSIHNAYRLGDEAPTDYLGAMGLAMSASAEGAWTELEPSGASPSAEHLAFYELHYLIQPEGGSLAALIDGEPAVELTTAGDRVELGRRRIDLRPGDAHTLRIELAGDGPVRLLGVVAETEEPGIILDTLGVNGAKTEDHARWDLELWSEHLRARAPDLYILAYGNNEAVDEDVPIAAYEASYREVLDRFRAAVPAAGCVMIGPTDFPKLEHGEVIPRLRLREIRRVQRELASDYDCAFLDARAIIGGEGAIAQWVEAGLARDDHLHMRRPGYVRYGMAIGDALMQRYDLRRVSAGVPEPTLRP